MRIKLDRQASLEALLLPSRVIPARSTIPILENVLLAVSTDSASITATDNEVWVRSDLHGASSEGPVKVLLPAKRFEATLKAMRDEVVLLNVGDKSVVIIGDSSQFTIPTEDANLYPCGFDAVGTSSATLLGDELALMMKRTSYANDQTTPALSGVCLEANGEELIAIGFDRRRMASQRFKVEYGGEPWPTKNRPIIPAKACRLWAQAAAEAGKGLVFVGVDHNTGRLATETVEIRTRLAAGVFPDWRMAVPSRSDASLSGRAGMFFDGVQQAATATSELSRGVSVSVRPRLLSLSARAADKGDSKVEIATETEGKHADVSVDGAYFAEMLRSVDSSLQITLKVVDDGGVVVSTGDGMLSLLAGMGG